MSHTLVSRCVGGEYILDRYSIGAIGYGAEINLGFSGDLAGEVLCPVSQIGGHPLRIEERTKKIIGRGRRVGRAGIQVSSVV